MSKEKRSFARNLIELAGKSGIEISTLLEHDDLDISVILEEIKEKGKISKSSISKIEEALP